jgi:large subunit ribosomal protein L9
MKIILRKDFENLGKIGDVCTVKDGYARNYLIPRKIAYAATPSSLKTLEEEKKQFARLESKQLKESERLKGEIEKVSITIPMKVGEDDKLFGSVTSQMVADALKEKGITVDKRHITMDEPIKTLGIFEIPIKIHTNVTATSKVWVVRE